MRMLVAPGGIMLRSLYPILKSSSLMTAFTVSQAEPSPPQTLHLSSSVSLPSRPSQPTGVHSPSTHTLRPSSSQEVPSIT